MSRNNNGPGFTAQPPQQQMQILDMGEGLYFSPLIGSLFVGFQVFKTEESANNDPLLKIVRSSEENARLIADPSAEVAIRLNTVGGEIMLTVGQSDRFLRMLGLRKNLVEVAPANIIQ